MVEVTEVPVWRDVSGSSVDCCSSSACAGAFCVGVTVSNNESHININIFFFS